MTKYECVYCHDIFYSADGTRTIKCPHCQEMLKVVDEKEVSK